MQAIDPPTVEGSPVLTSRFVNNHCMLTICRVVTTACNGDVLSGLSRYDLTMQQDCVPHFREKMCPNTLNIILYMLMSSSLSLLKPAQMLTLHIMRVRSMADSQKAAMLDCRHPAFAMHGHILACTYCGGDINCEI